MNQKCRKCGTESKRFRCEGCGHLPFVETALGGTICIGLIFGAASCGSSDDKPQGEPTAEATQAQVGPSEQELCLAALPENPTDIATARKRRACVADDELMMSPENLIAFGKALPAIEACLAKDGGRCEPIDHVGTCGAYANETRTLRDPELMAYHRAACEHDVALAKRLMGAK